jgi:hypothetical protein
MSPDRREVCRSRAARACFRARACVLPGTGVRAFGHGRACFRATTLTPGLTLVGGDTTALGSLAYVRLALTLVGAATAAHVKLWVTGRDTVA